MLRNLFALFRYRGLIQTLVVRDLKARYRGSVLGFFWSFVNPLLLLLIYSFVFTVVLPGAHPKELEPYALFMFCGILPWTWFSSSLLEASNVLISGGNLIKKVLFPAEVLPIVTVLANMVHFLFGLPILAGFLVYYRHSLNGFDLLWFPLVVLTQLLLTIGLAFVVSALTVHFRDIQSILNHVLHLWFFATPVIYSYAQIAEGTALRQVLRLNPMTHVIVTYQQMLFHGNVDHWRGLFLALLVGVVAFAAGAFLFDRLRDTLAEEV